MPYTVTEQRRADRLHVGMHVSDFGEQFVRAVRVKVKFTYLDLAPSMESEDVTRDVKFANDELVDVLIQKLTDEEQLERERERATWWVTTTMNFTLTDGNPADYLERQVTEWRDRDGQPGNVLDWSEATTFFHRQAQFWLWRVIDHTYLRLVDLYGDDEVTPLSALVIELKTARPSYPTDPASRSTNVFSNVIDDLKRYAWEKLRDDVRSHVSPELLEQEYTRVMQLRAELDQTKTE